jgi:hypothetical protein
MLSKRQKATWTDALVRAPARLRVVRDPGTYVRLLHGNREISAPAPGSRSWGRIGKT